jgi:hypothetical protein
MIAPIADEVKPLGLVVRHRGCVITQHPLIDGVLSASVRLNSTPPRYPTAGKGWFRSGQPGYVVAGQCTALDQCGSDQGDTVASERCRDQPFGGVTVAG